LEIIGPDQTLGALGGTLTNFTNIDCTGLGVSNKLNSSVTTDPNSWVWSASVVNGQLIVTFADLFGPVTGGGAVDVFNTDGVFQSQIDANDPTSSVAANATGRLENPWGVTLAPADFGMYSNDLLVGNVWGPGHINAYDPNTGAYLGQLSQPNGTPIAIKGLWDLEFGDGTPDSGKTNQLFFDAGPNHPGDSTGGLFGVIHAAGDQSGNGGGGSVREAAAPSQPVQQWLTRPPLQPVVLQAIADWQSAGATAAQPVSSPGPALAAGTPGASVAGSSQAVPLVSTPRGLALGVHAYWVRDQGFADLVSTQSVALAPSADPPWTW
jgi:hypothetical protein